MPYSIAVVTWQSARFLEALVASMNRHLDGSQQLIVVDNASGDDAEAAARRWRGETDFVRLETNRGFGAANNVAIERARHPAVVMLNPDSELVDSSLDALASAAIDLRALVGPRLLNPDGSVQPSASGPEVGLSPWLRAVLPGAVTPPALLASTEPSRLPGRTRVDWLTGACVAGPRDLLRTLGPFDPAIHLYGEDLDLGLRAGRAGVRSYLCADTCRVIHHGGASSSLAYDSSYALQLDAMRTRRAVLRRTYGRRRERLGWAALLLDLSLRSAAKTFSRRAARDRIALAAALGARRFAELPQRAPGLHGERRLRTLAVLHLAEAGGPAQHVRPWLAALADRGSLEVVVPAEGPARALYASLGETTVLSYKPLMLPRSPLAFLRFAVRFARETRSFSRHIKRTSPDLVVLVTSALPAALLAARLRRVPALVYVAEIFDKGYVRSRYRTATAAVTIGYTMRLADALVCCSEAVARQLRPGSPRPETTTGCESATASSGPIRASPFSATSRAGGDRTS